MSVMQGFERADRQLLDATALAGHLVPESMFSFLAAHRGEIFPDADYADLFSPPGGGAAVAAGHADGGPTSLADCVLLCSYHHQIVIHRWGWSLVLNKDGTTTALNPDRTKVLHSHSPPPARAG
jgi:hypothetical protein